MACAIDEEFGEIPLDPARTENAGGLLFQPIIKRNSPVAVDIDLFHDRETDIIGQFAKTGDFCGIARLLLAKLVAGESNDFKARVRVFAVKRLEPFILGREAALAGGVHNQQNLALFVGKVLHAAIRSFDREVADDAQAADPGKSRRDASARISGNARR